MGKSIWWRRSKQLREKNDSFQKKGVERVESTNLAKQNALEPKEESRSEIDVGFQESQQNQKKSMKKSKSFLGKILPRRGKPLSASSKDSGDHKETLLSAMQSSVPQIVKQPLPAKLFTMLRRKRSPNDEQRQFVLKCQATVQPDVEAKTQLGAEAEMEEVAGRSHLPAGRAAKRFWRMPVRQGQQKEVLSSSKKRLRFPVLKKKKRGLEESLQKTALPLKNLQMQVDDCKQIVIDQVRKQLDQQNAELQHCESVSDQFLQFSHQFQRVSKRAAWKSKLKNMFFCLSPCCCCCDFVFDWL